MTQRLRGILAISLLLIVALACARRGEPSAVTANPASRPIVILISIDGWRWDYTDRYRPPVIGALAKRGVRAEGLVPIFPSKTFPNHYTIVTGLPPARHGIVSNNMVDPNLPGRFSLSNREVLADPRWWWAEPLWVTAERQGVIAATMFWPGSDVMIAGDRPTFWKTYDDDFSNEARVDALLEWLDRPEAERPSFLTLYFSDVDDAGHRFGPESASTHSAVLAIDRMIERLTDGVQRLGLTPRVNFVIVSDHGMSPLSPDRVIVLDDYVDLRTVDVIDTAPIVGLNPQPGIPVESIYAALKDKHPALKVYLRSNLPERYGLRNHPRMAQVIGIADDGWHPTTRERMERETFHLGNHGYDPDYRSMHGVFIASGPQFRIDVTVPAFSNLHVYELICRVLSIEPAPNDGSLLVTESFLR